MGKMIQWQNVVTKKTGVISESGWETIRNHPLARGRYKKIGEINEKPRHYIADKTAEEEE